MKSRVLFHLKDAVTDMLKEFPEARDDDELLTLYVYSFYGIDINRSFRSVLMSAKSDGYPNRESIRRVRQKVQEENEDLRGSTRVRKARLDEQVEYIKFAKGDEESA